MGVMIFTGWMNGISGYLNSLGNKNLTQESEDKSDLVNHAGNIVGYVPGMMTKDIMINVINQTLHSTE